MPASSETTFSALRCLLRDYPAIHALVTTATPQLSSFATQGLSMMLWSTSDLQYYWEPFMQAVTRECCNRVRRWGGCQRRYLQLSLCGDVVAGTAKLRRTKHEPAARCLVVIRTEDAPS